MKMMTFDRMKSINPSEAAYCIVERQMNRVRNRSFYVFAGASSFRVSRPGESECSFAEQKHRLVGFYSLSSQPSANEKSQMIDRIAEDIAAFVDDYAKKLFMATGGGEGYI